MSILYASTTSLPNYSTTTMNGLGGMAGYRRDGRVGTEVSKGQKEAPMMPRELFGVVSPDVWVERCSALQALHERYYGSLVEKILWVLAFLCSFTLPWPLMSVVERVSSDDATFFEVKMVGIALFFGCILFFFGPLVGWKLLARHRLRTLLAKYKTQDGHRSYPASMQLWSIESNQYIANASGLTIVVTIPPPPGAVSTFHPDAYLPAYIQKLASTASLPSNPETGASVSAVPTALPPSLVEMPAPAATRKEMV